MKIVIGMWVWMLLAVVLMPALIFGGTITATAVDWPDEVVVSLTNIDTGPEPETLPAPDVSQLDDLIVVLELTVT